jgi:hypothetical protein
MLRRPMTSWESRDFRFHNNVALAFQLADKSAVSHVLDKLDRSVIGLHLKSDDGCYVHVPSPAIQYRIPNQIRDLQRAVAWVNEHHPNDPTHRLGVLASNDSKVVLNLSHSVSDGGYFKFLTEHLFEPAPPHLPPLPPTLEQIFEEEYSQARHIDIHGLNCISSHHSSLEGNSLWCKYETLRFRGDEVQCFRRTLNRFTDVTDYVWMALLLASAVHTGALPDFAGIGTCVDLRARLKKSLSGYDALKFFSVLHPQTVISPSFTLREVGRRLREDMRRREMELEDIATMKFADKLSAVSTSKGIALGISNVGPLRIKWPIVDAWASVRVQSSFSASFLTVLSFSVIGEKKNDLVVRLRFADSKLGDDEAFEMAKSMGYVLRNILLDRTLQSAFDELTEVKAFSGVK